MALTGAELQMTERFLLSQPDVLKASVWVERGYVFANVTVAEDAEVTNRELLNACKKELGLRYSPAEIMMLHAKQRAA